MSISASPALLFVACVGVLMLFSVVVSFRLRPSKQSRVAIVIAVSPAILMLALFYSLAFHMHHTLGAWPTSIGENGFSKPLVTHADIAGDYFSILMLVSILAWPVVFLLCLLIRRWRVCVYYLGAYALACLVCFGAMLLAPSQFLDWWWD